MRTLPFMAALAIALVAMPMHPAPAFATAPVSVPMYLSDAPIGDPISSACSDPAAHAAAPDPRPVIQISPVGGAIQVNYAFTAIPTNFINLSTCGGPEVHIERDPLCNFVTDPLCTTGPGPGVTTLTLPAVSPFYLAIRAGEGSLFISPPIRFESGAFVIGGGPANPCDADSVLWAPLGKTAGARGGGLFLGNGASARGGFTVLPSGDAYKGELQFNDNVVKYHANTVTALQISADGRLARFTGSSEGVLFSACAVDNGEPGTTDGFWLTIGPTAVAYGTIQGGNIQVRN